MAIFGAGGWIGSLFFRGATEKAKLSGPEADEKRPGVTINGALQIGTVWACARLLSETIGTLPLSIYRKDGAGNQAADSDHPLYGLLHDSPNADQTAAEFWEAVVACLCLWGNSYAEIVRGPGKRLVALNFLRPDLMSVVRDRNGARIYRYADPQGMREYREDEVFHVRGFGVGGDVGLSPVGAARKMLGLAIDTDDAAASAMRHGVRGAGFLEVPGKPTPDQKRDLWDTFVAPITGPKGSGRGAVLESGMKWNEVKGMPPEDLQLIQARAFNVEEICRWFRVPPFMIGHTEKSTSWGTGLEQQMIGFLTFSLSPYLKRIEQAIKKQLIAPAERKTVFAEFILDGLMRADSVGRAAIWNAAAQNGVRTRNEIRRKENLPPMPGGDVLTVQSNLVPLDQLGAAGGDQHARAAFMNWLGLDQVVASAVKSALIGHNGGPPMEEDP